MYIVLEIQTNKDGTVGNLVYAYPTRREAEEKYHLILASAARSDLPCHSACILDEKCNMQMFYSYENREEAAEA